MTRTEEQKAFIWKATDRRRASFIAQAEKQVIGALNKQIAPVIAAIADGKKDIDSLIKDKPIEEAFISIYTTVGVAFAKEEFNKHKSSGIEYHLKAAAEESVWLRFMRNFAVKESGTKIVKISDTTLKHVRRTLDEAVKEGYSIDKTAEFMKNEFSEINKTRATVIARTEIVSASNRGSLLGAQSTGIPLDKEWISTRDSRTRRISQGDAYDHYSSAVDSQRVDINGFFIVQGEKLEHPGDSTNGASAGNTINCRCSLVYEPKTGPAIPKPTAQPAAKPSFTPAKSTQEAEQFAKESLITTVESYKGYDLEVANQINKSLFEIEQAFKEVPKTKIGSKVSGKAYGQYDWNENTVLIRKSYKDVEVRRIADNNQWRKQYGDDYHVTTNLDGIIKHEFAHAFDNVTKRALYKELRTLPLDDRNKLFGISGYASSDRWYATGGPTEESEMIAEVIGAKLTKSPKYDLLPAVARAIIDKYFN